LDLCVVFVAINPIIIIGRSEQTQIIRNALQLKKSSFIAITGRRRVGKIVIVRAIYEEQV
jgi:AAA+ ATPase superfamily predicted ATPase